MTKLRGISPELDGLRKGLRIIEAKICYQELYANNQKVDSSNLYSGLNLQHVKLSDNQQLTGEGMLTFEECSITSFSICP